MSSAAIALGLRAEAALVAPDACSEISDFWRLLRLLIPRSPVSEKRSLNTALV